MIYLSHIISGSKLPSLSNPGTASDLLSGKQLINENGEIVIGSIPSQSGTTITPGTSQKTACAAGRYVTGDIIVAGDSDLISSNIKSGVNIFGVDGTADVVETVTGTIDTGYGEIRYITTNGPGVVHFNSNTTISNVIKGSFLIFYEPQVDYLNFNWPTVSGLTQNTYKFIDGIHNRPAVLILYIVTDNFSLTYHG